MRGISILAAALVVALIIESFSRVDWFRNSSEWAYNGVHWRCNDGLIDEKFCESLLPPLRSIYAHLVRRISIPKSDLPVLHIYMTDGALAKLHKTREIMMLQKFPLLPKGKDDWVRATIVADNGKNIKETNVTLRLKGDGSDHWNDPKRLSFRIKVANRQLVWGMSKFSIHRPRTRNYQNEALILAMMRRLGVLAPRYFFVEVRINGEKGGIMALEEHFTKEMVESKSRREGPIIKLHEDWYWKQRSLGDDDLADWIDFELKFSRECVAGNVSDADRPVVIFQPGQFSPGTVRSQHMMRGVSLLWDSMAGRIRGDLVFDLDLVSLWWIVVVIWEAPHGLASNNSRLYFNPVSSRLEPISFDNNPELGAKNPFKKISLNSIVDSLLHSLAFRELTRNNIKKIEDLLDSEEFQQWFTSEQNQHLMTLWVDNISRKPIVINDLRENLFTFSNDVEILFSTRPVSTNSTQLLENIKNDPIHGRKFMESGVPLYSHLRPFWFWSAEGADIEIKNMTLDPITVHSIFFNNHPKNSLVSPGTTIPVYQENSAAHIFKSLINVSAFDLSDQMKISYSYQDQQYTRPVFLQFRNFKPGYENQETARAWFDDNGVLMNPATKTITFVPGHYSLLTSLETEKGWRVEFLPGAVIEFKQGTRLKVNGPVQALGQEDLPVKMVINSNPERGLLGSWGGLLVVDAVRESILRHTQVFGSAGSRLANRQDSYGLTGCVTFFKSNVRIEHSKFSNLQCEDALNIISSDFNIDHVEFVASSADAFDSDFSNGIVTNSTFRRIVNDGIDLSGSQVQANSSWFYDIRDKAISVGEDSHLDVNELTIDGADAGVVSKDKSVVKISNGKFINVNSALMAYVKKEEWGPAEIHCENCLFDNVESIAVEQYASRITVEGKELSPKKFTLKQLQISGYIQ